MFLYKQIGSPLSCEGPPAKPLPSTLRVDGDGGATSSRSQKAALTELLTSDNDVRDLIIAFREPAFDSQLGQKWLRASLTIGTGRRRGGAGREQQPHCSPGTSLY